MAGNTYNASSIRALDQHTHLLKRISLTFGPEEDDGVPYAAQKGVAIREILDNALDEARAGYGDNIRIKFFKDTSFEIQDSGRGIPVDVGYDSNGNPASGIYLSLGVIQSGGKFETDSKRYSSGLNGVGASSTVHLSKRADITVFRNKKKYTLSFKDGTPGFFAVDDDPESAFTELKDYTYVKEEKDTRSAQEKKLFPTGTIVKIWLRDSVFTSDKPYDSRDITDRVKYTAFLVPTLNVEIYDEISTVEDPATGNQVPREETYHFTDGLSDFMDSISSGKEISDRVFLSTEASFIQKNTPVIDPKTGGVVHKNVQRTMPIELALQWNATNETNVYSYVNTIHTKLGGSHVKGFQKALMSALTPKITGFRGMFKSDWGEPIIEDFMSGLNVIISVQVSEPNFSSQSKEEYSSTEAQRGIAKSLQSTFEQWMNNRKNEENLRKIAQKISDNLEIRMKEKDRMEANRQAKELKKKKASDKLTDCTYAGKVQKESTELMICEGNSAASALIAARDPRYNAILAIRGKIINAYKSPMKDVLANKEIEDIITSLGAGIGDDFDVKKMRYGRVVIVTDADPDGKAIACLIYAMMYRIFPGILEQNRLYASIPPLFTVKRPGDEEENLGYANSEDELNELLPTIKGKYEIIRNKGLGEMSAQQLYDTVVDPTTRSLIRINSDDVKKASDMLEVIMGDDVSRRREWIAETDVDEELVLQG